MGTFLFAAAIENPEKGEWPGFMAMGGKGHGIY
jgi:hypothetical protein